jgi:hypothetical protein
MYGTKKRERIKLDRLKKREILFTVLLAQRDAHWLGGSPSALSQLDEEARPYEYRSTGSCLPIDLFSPQAFP